MVSNTFLHGFSFTPPTLHHNFSSYIWDNASDYDHLNSIDIEYDGLPGPFFLHPHWRAMEPLESKLFSAIGVIMTLVGFFGAVGNFTVIFLLLRCKKLQTSANMYVFNLASADLLMCLGNFPLLIVSCFAEDWVTGYTSCKIYAFIGGLAGFVSINTLTAMACDRYNVIYRHRGLMKSRSRRHSLGLLLSVWIYSFLWSVPPFFGWGYFKLDGGRISCCFDYLTRSSGNVAYIIAIFVFCFGIQMVVIFFCYANIVIAVCQHERSITRAKMQICQRNNHHHLYHTPHQASAMGAADHITVATATSSLGSGEDRSCPKQRRARRRRVEFQVTRLVLCITLSFCFCWTPFAVVALIGVFGDADVVTPLVSVLPGILAKISTVINPILYAIGHPHYRNVLLKHWRRAQPCRAPPEQDGALGRQTNASHSNGGMGFLSSMYFASVMRESESGTGMAVQLADCRSGDATVV